MKALASVSLAVLSIPLFAQTCPTFRNVLSESPGSRQTITLCSGQFVEILNDNECSFTVTSATFPVDIYRGANKEVSATKSATLVCGLRENFAIHNPRTNGLNTVQIVWNSSAEDDRAEANRQEPDFDISAAPQNSTQPSSIQTFALSAGHNREILNTYHVLTIHVTSDFPVTIRERGCLMRDVMDATFHCRFGSDIYIYDQRPFFSLGAEPNAITIDWSPKDQ